MTVVGSLRFVVVGSLRFVVVGSLRFVVDTEKLTVKLLSIKALHTTNINTKNFYRQFVKVIPDNRFVNSE